MIISRKKNTAQNSNEAETAATNQKLIATATKSLKNWGHAVYTASKEVLFATHLVPNGSMESLLSTTHDKSSLGRRRSKSLESLNIAPGADTALAAAVEKAALSSKLAPTGRHRRSKSLESLTAPSKPAAMSSVPVSPTDANSYFDGFSDTSSISMHSNSTRTSPNFNPQNYGFSSASQPSITPRELSPLNSPAFNADNPAYPTASPFASPTAASRKKVHNNNLFAELTLPSLQEEGGDLAATANHSLAISSADSQLTAQAADNELLMSAAPALSRTSSIMHEIKVNPNGVKFKFSAGAEQIPAELQLAEGHDLLTLLVSSSKKMVEELKLNCEQQETLHLEHQKTLKLTNQENLALTDDQETVLAENLAVKSQELIDALAQIESKVQEHTHTSSANELAETIAQINAEIALEDNLEFKAQELSKVIAQAEEKEQLSELEEKESPEELAASELKRQKLTQEYKPLYNFVSFSGSGFGHRFNESIIGPLFDLHVPGETKQQFVQRMRQLGIHAKFSEQSKVCFYGNKAKDTVNHTVSFDLYDKQGNKIAETFSDFLQRMRKAGVPLLIDNMSSAEKRGLKAKI